jgi:hypothetical protein
MIYTLIPLFLEIFGQFSIYFCIFQVSYNSLITISMTWLKKEEIYMLLTFSRRCCTTPPQTSHSLQQQQPNVQSLP